MPRLAGQPIQLCAATNSNNSERPRMTSGTTSGTISIKPKTSRPRKRRKRLIAKPAQAPRTSAIVAAMTAISTLVSAASRYFSLAISAPYQRIENPPHTVTSREPLKE